MAGKVKVLMADDEPDVLMIMAKKLREHGFDVIEATDGEDAWDKIRIERPDIVLLDLVMPGMDGFEVLKKLRQDPPDSKWRPVIIVSAKDELTDMQRGFSLEADHYIPKPCRIEDIVKGINLMLKLIPQRKISDE